MTAKTRRLKFDEERKARFLELVAKGYGRTKACVKVGITRQTFGRHYDKSEKFRAAVLDAEEEANDVVEMALYKTAIDGNVTAQQVWLYNRASDRWADRRNISLSGDNKNPIRVEMRDYSDDQLRAIIRATKDSD